MSARPSPPQPPLFPDALGGDRVGTRRGLAEALGISERHAGRLVAGGVLPPKARGGWSVSACRAVLEERTRGVRSDEAWLLAERIRLTRGQADAQAMANATQRAQFVAAPAARDAILAARKHVERTVLALPRRGGAMLVGIDAVAPMQAALTALVRDALEALAGTTTLPTAAPPRRRKRAEPA